MQVDILYTSENLNTRVLEEIDESLSYKEMTIKPCPYCHCTPVFELYRSPIYKSDGYTGMYIPPFPDRLDGQITCDSILCSSSVHMFSHSDITMEEGFSILIQAWNKMVDFIGSK